MARAFLLVLDSVGIGAAADAAAYGDAGSDTVGHVAETTTLSLPNLVALGLGQACHLSTGRVPPGLEGPVTLGRFGYAVERSKGKDTPSGHWEIAGLPVPFAWGYFPETVPAFPRDLIDAIVAEAGLPGVLALKHASGTTVIDEFGAESVVSGKPIVYTSADSVIQIAAHENHFGLARLYELCAITRRHVDALNIGRVIARPFVGDAKAGFARTANRRDYAVPPPADTILDVAARAGRTIVTIGKIGDIFAHRATGTNLKGPSNAALLETTRAAMDDLPDGGFLFANYVDFDTLYGHRRDPVGYARALEAFDASLPALRAALRPGDLMILTADHGCDPTFRGTDHTREHVPVLIMAPGLSPGSIGKRDSFADIGATVARHLGLDWRGAGAAIL